MPRYPDLVEDRLNGPPGQRSLCHICPLNGRKKVGHDGPLDAPHIAIFDGPYEDDERDGRILTDKTGYFTKIRHYYNQGLVELLPGRKPEYPRIGRLAVHLMPVIMCVPPRNHRDAAGVISSVIGKKAVLCCSNSAIRILNRALEANPNISLHPAGGTSLSLLRGEKTSIEPFRGRVMLREPGQPFPYIPEDYIYKKVLRGVKPKEEWWPAFETWLKSFIKLFKKSSRRIDSMYAKQEKEQFLQDNTWLTDWAALWRRQKAAATRRAKKEASCTPT